MLPRDIRRINPQKVTDVYRQRSSSKLSQVTLQLVLREHDVVLLFDKHAAHGEMLASLPLAALKDSGVEKFVSLHSQWHVVSFVPSHIINAAEVRLNKQ